MAYFELESEDYLLGVAQRTRAEAEQIFNAEQLPAPGAGVTFVAYINGALRSVTLSGTTNEISVSPSGVTITLAFDTGYFLKGYNTASAIRGRIACGGIAAADPNDSITASATYQQGELQALIDEVHDLKDKLRTAGVIAP